MSDIIQLLPESVANQIAAGEVIQRPASVVKELVENAIDAGSEWIQIIVKNAGKTLIQVIDDGKGMSELDARMSFERHATSKIRSAADIFNITTNGFRGEALASIASIAQVEMKTRQAENEMGISILIEGSNLKKQEFCETLQGTSISVKNLFFNTPARRRFLKKDATELAHIIEEFKRASLAHPEIRFNFYHNNEEIYHLPKGKLKQRIISLFGKVYNEKLIPVEEETNVVEIAGFVGNQDAARSTRGDQYFFVNNRFIKSPYLNHAIKNAYENIIGEEQYPFYVIFLTIDPAKIDVNIHPTKQEIKFEEEKLIYNFLRVTIKHSLGKYIITPIIDFDNDASLDRSVNPMRNPQGSSFQSPSFGGGNHLKNKNPVWESLYADLKTDPAADEDPLTLSATLDSESAETWSSGTQQQKLPYQLHNRFIVNQIKSGFIIIDQQNAHERILFEKQLHLLNNGKAEIQNLLFPQSIDLKKDDFLLMSELYQEINLLGFDIDLFGGNSFVVRGAPTGLEAAKVEETLMLLLDQFKNNIKLEIDLKENIARSYAKASSVKTGVALSDQEMKNLINELFACETPFKTPSGKNCFITYELNDIKKEFE